MRPPLSGAALGDTRQPGSQSMVELVYGGQWTARNDSFKAITRLELHELARRGLLVVEPTNVACLPAVREIYRPMRMKFTAVGTNVVRR